MLMGFPEEWCVMGGTRAKDVLYMLNMISIRATLTDGRWGARAIDVSFVCEKDAR